MRVDLKLCDPKFPYEKDLIDGGIFYRMDGEDCSSEDFDMELWKTMVLRSI